MLPTASKTLILLYPPILSALAALPPMQNSQHTVLTIRLYILYHCSTVDFMSNREK